MIRDPSDGSVKEITLTSNETKTLAVKTAPEGIISGLPPEKAKQAVRLQESRDWLKQYFEPKA